MRSQEFWGKNMEPLEVAPPVWKNGKTIVLFPSLFGSAILFGLRKHLGHPSMPGPVLNFHLLIRF